MKPIKALLVLTVFAALAVPTIAQNHRIPININFTGSDTIGQAFNYALKEQLVRSAIFQYSASNTGFVLNVVSIDSYEGSPSFDTYKNNSSAISITFTIQDKDGTTTLLDQRVMTVGKDKTDEMAKTLLVSVNTDIDLMQKALTKYTTESPAVSKSVTKK